MENIGLSQALNDMLLQSTRAGNIHLFPSWPLDEPASFTTLRTCVLLRQPLRTFTTRIAIRYIQP